MPTIVAFGEDKAFFTSSDDGDYVDGLPNGLDQVVKGDRNWFWVSMGPDDQYYAAWSRDDGKEFYRLGIKTGGYKGLDTKLHTILSNHSLRNVKVVFGPKKDSWMLLSSSSKTRHNLGSDIAQAIDEEDSSLKHVALGAHNTWVLLFKNGAVRHNIDGYYGSLGNSLDDASDGDVKSVFLNPFNSHQYVLAYRGGRKKSSMPGDWADNVHF